MGIFSEAMSLSFAKWQHRDSYDDLTALVWSPYSGYCNLSFDYCIDRLTCYMCPFTLITCYFVSNNHYVQLYQIMGKLNNLRQIIDETKPQSTFHQCESQSMLAMPPLLFPLSPDLTPRLGFPHG